MVLDLWTRVVAIKRVGETSPDVEICSETGTGEERAGIAHTEGARAGLTDPKGGSSGS